MTRKAALLIMLLSVIALVVTIYLVSGTTANSGFKDSAAVLTFVGGAAVAIERSIEAMWTFIGGVAGTYWPLNLINNQVKTMVGELDSAIKPIYDQAKKKIDELAKAKNWSQQEIQKAKGEVESLEARFNELKDKLPPDNERVKLLIAAASQHVDFLKAKYKEELPNLDAAANIANTAIDGLQNFLASFKDNPGRRLISLFLGVILGLLVAGYFGLDLFQAVLGSSDPTKRIQYILLTGLVMGLGSSPTHEVIRAVQEYKKTRKGENIGKPDLPPNQP